MCPVINKIPKRPKKERKVTDMRKLRATAYNSKEWRRLRDLYMHEHPICADCLANGKITPAEDIHHIVSPFRGGEVNYNLLLDYNNLVSLCKECHAARHNKEQGHRNPEEILRALDELFEELEKDEQI